jgi:hypothetical protein
MFGGGTVQIRPPPNQVTKQGLYILAIDVHYMMKTPLMVLLCVKASRPWELVSAIDDNALLP